MNDFEETVLLVKKYAEQMIADGVKTVEAGEKILCPDPDKKGIANREKTFIELSGRVNQCKKCPLGLTRKKNVAVSRVRPWPMSMWAALSITKRYKHGPIAWGRILRCRCPADAIKVDEQSAGRLGATL